MAREVVFRTPQLSSFDARAAQLRLCLLSLAANGFAPSNGTTGCEGQTVMFVRMHVDSRGCRIALARRPTRCREISVSRSQSG